MTEMTERDNAIAVALSKVRPGLPRRWYSHAAKDFLAMLAAALAAAPTWGGKDG